MTDQKQEPVAFDAPSIDEMILFGNHVGSPWKDFTDAWTATIIDFTAELAKGTRAGWYREMLEGRPEGWEKPEPDLPAPPEGFTPVQAAVWEANTAAEMERAAAMTEDELWLCWMADRAEEGVAGRNLVEWTLDVMEEYPELNALSLRRVVSDELKIERKAAGDWQLWRCGVVWLHQRRRQAANGEAQISWADFRAQQEADATALLGSRLLVSFVTGAPIDILESTGDGEDFMVPLDGGAENSEDPPVAAV